MGIIVRYFRNCFSLKRAATAMWFMSEATREAGKKYSGIVPWMASVLCSEARLHLDRHSCAGSFQLRN